MLQAANLPSKTIFYFPGKPLLFLAPEPPVNKVVYTLSWEATSVLGIWPTIVQGPAEKPGDF